MQELNDRNSELVAQLEMMRAMLAAGGVDLAAGAGAYGLTGERVSGSTAAAAGAGAGAGVSASAAGGKGAMASRDAPRLQLLDMPDTESTTDTASDAPTMEMSAIDLELNSMSAALDAGFQAKQKPRADDPVRMHMMQAGNVSLCVFFVCVCVCVCV